MLGRLTGSITRAARRLEGPTHIGRCSRTLYGLAEGDTAHEDTNFYDSTVQKVDFCSTWLIGSL